MNDISFYLKKFEGLGLKESSIKKIVIESVKKAVNIDLSKEDIQVVRDQIRIKKTGSEKSEIFINKNKIEELINKELNYAKKVI